MEYGLSFSLKFGELLCYISPGQRFIISHMAPPKFPNENEVIPFYCDIVAPSLISKLCVYMLDIIPSRGVYTNNYSHKYVGSSSCDK